MIKNILIISAFIFSSNLYAETLPIHVFLSNDSAVIGKLYIKFNKYSLIESANIIRNGRILYTINSNGFYNEKGLQMKCGCKPFYGFTIGSLTAQGISMLMADKDGREVSDEASIVWNPESNKFTYVFLP